MTPTTTRITKRKVNTPQKTRIVDFLRSSPTARRMTYDQLAQALELNVTKSTVSRALPQFKRCVAQQEVFLSEIHKAKRLEFCNAYKHWSKEQWRCVAYV